MTEIPEWIDDELNIESSQDVQDRHFIEAFLKSDSPYLSRNQVQSVVGLSDQRTRERLRDLEEMRLIESDAVANSRIYWIRNEESDWPIPPDVEVEPISQDPTIPELLGRLYVQYAVLGVFMAIVGSLLMTLFTLAFAYELSLPVIQLSNLLLAGVLATVVGLVFITIAFATWIIEKYTTLSIPGFFKTN